jgi:hypothetical protein
VIDFVPGERITIALPEDTWGPSKILEGVVVETVLVPGGKGETILAFEAYYEPIWRKTRLLNGLFLRPFHGTQSLARH